MPGANALAYLPGISETKKKKFYNIYYRTSGMLASVSKKVRMPNKSFYRGMLVGLSLWHFQPSLIFTE